MVARPGPFRQVDVTRALKSALAAGLIVTDYKIAPDGSILVRVAGAGDQPVEMTDLDRWKAGRHARTP
jgi:hypothetical protein